ncbi:beta strand repeat-containing protein [Nostoc sp.]|uniref:beta strand repeat-containing protein n=1 Tax=Nostoc sp. TaxID=1180 RepID=UPI002FF7BEDE
MANIIGTNGNDTLIGSDFDDTINGKAGDDIIRDSYGNDTLTGGGGKDEFFYSLYDGNCIITDFGGIGKGINPSTQVIAEVDTLKFQGAGFTAQNLLLTQNGNNLEINFEGVIDYSYGVFAGPLVILQNFALEKLDNLSQSTGATVNLGNFLFDGQTSITDSFDVFNANSTQSTIFNKNTVTFLNDLNNNVNGFDNSNDVINAQGGDDIIDGLSGNDILRGGAGNDTLLGGAGNDTLEGDMGNNSLVGGIGNDYLNIVENSTGKVEFSTGNNILNGGTGDDTLNAGASKGDNLLFGGDGNDSLYASDITDNTGYRFFNSSGDNTLNGGTGEDTLNAQGSEGNNLLSGGDGNDFLTTSGSDVYRLYGFSSSGNNTLNGGTGDDKLYADFSSGNNLLSGGDGNDTLSSRGHEVPYDDYIPTSGDNTLNGGAGNDKLYAEISTGNDFLFGGDGNDSFYLNPPPLDTAPSNLVTQTVDGGKGNDLLRVNYSLVTEGITSTFNATSNTGSITAGTYQVNYKDIEGLDISGTAYNDKIVGSNGNDILRVSNGNDTLYGGAGTDTFVLDGYNGGVDSLYDFNTSELIQIVPYGFGGSELSIGSLSASQFTIGTSATTSEERFIYNSATGGLFFDQDGSASGFTQVKIAQLSAGLSLTNNNFAVVEPISPF